MASESHEGEEPGTCKQSLVADALPWQTPAGRLAALIGFVRYDAMYEATHQRLLSRAAFVRRVVGHVVVALLALVLSLVIGILGYHEFERLPYIDAFLNAAMLLGGMGPVDLPHTDAGKIFAALYALYSGVVFLLVSTILVAPFIHRLLHHFHWSEKI